MNPEIETTPAHGERQHHRHSPSTLQSKETCQGYFQTNSTNERAEAGTRMHEAADSGAHEHLDDDQHEAVVGYLAFVESKRLEYGEDATCLTEEYLPIDNREPIPTTAGFVDRVIISADGSKACVIDLKTGLNAVEPPENNVQLITYLLGLIFAMRESAGIVPDTVESVLVCPFIDGGVILSHTFKKEDYEGLELRVRTIVAGAEEADKAFEEFDKAETFSAKAKALAGIRFNPTSACLFCDRLGKCPAVNALALKVSEKYPPLEIPRMINPALIESAEDAGKGLRFFQVMEALSKAFRKRCTDLTLTKEEWTPEGYQVVMTTRRTIKDKVIFYETVKPILTEEEFLRSIDFTLGPVEEAIKAKAPRGKKKAAVEELKLLLHANGATSESEPIATLRMVRGSGEKPVELET